MQFVVRGALAFIDEHTIQTLVAIVQRALGEPTRGHNLHLRGP